jgi:hypothetical protein
VRTILIVAGLSVAGLSGLAACATPPDLMNRDLETVALTNTGDEIVAPPIDFARPVLRSYVPGPDGAWQEVAGARCRVEVGPYTAIVTPPVRLVVPDMRPVEMPLVATCTLGENSGQAIFASRQGLQGPYATLAVGMKPGGAVN